MDGDSEGEGVPLVAFNEITFEKSKILKSLMFRMAESPDVIIVSNKIVDALINNRPEGGWQIDLVEVGVI